MIAFKQHYQRMGARLARTGGWTSDEAQRHCELIGLGALERSWVLEGLAAEHQHNPTGAAGQPLIHPTFDPT